ncbi:protein C19orf12 homolog [Sitophilus oryzae]|uniref:Protein C19orf12 homolog n=1 Tax=Sitophilus oryzae TaxID=7048 RepID=A0A6J2YM46_SITOR|nr:protein C19orf12 homolog [Sitophilus oryzae]
MLNTRNDETRKKIIEICQTLAEQQELTVTVTESAKGALITGIGVFVGGILLGPLGMAFGGIVSSVGVAVSSKGKFRSVAEIISEMPEDKKDRLINSLTDLSKSFNYEDVLKLLTIALTSADVNTAVITLLKDFVIKELKLQITNY